MLSTTMEDYSRRVYGITAPMESRWMEIEVPVGLEAGGDLLIILEHGGLICIGKDVIFKQVG